MAQHDLVGARIQVDASKDNVTIDKVFETIRGGRTLDVTGFADDTIQAGHVIFVSAEGEYVPQPVDGSIPNDGETEPTDFAVAGILTKSILAAEPLASIMTRGTVNEATLKYEITAATKALLGDRIAYVNA